MPRAPPVHVDLELRPFARERAGRAGVIEVDVGEDQALGLPAVERLPAGAAAWSSVRNRSGCRGSARPRCSPAGPSSGRRPPRSDRPRCSCRLIRSGETQGRGARRSVRPRRGRRGAGAGRRRGRRPRRRAPAVAPRPVRRCRRSNRAAGRRRSDPASAPVRCSSRAARWPSSASSAPTSTVVITENGSIGRPAASQARASRARRVATSSSVGNTVLYSSP